MERLSVGDIVFVRFPFSDLSQYKLRPALVLAKAWEPERNIKKINDSDPLILCYSFQKQA